jgi:hypothetical protein
MAISRIIFKNQWVFLEFYGPQLDFVERQGANYKMVGTFLGADLFFNGKIMVDSFHHPWTTGTPVHSGLAMADQRGLTGARPSGSSRGLTGRGTTGRGLHGEATSGLTGTQAAVWRPVNGGEEMAEEALGASSSVAASRRR